MKNLTPLQSLYLQDTSSSRLIEKLIDHAEKVFGGKHTFGSALESFLATLGEAEPRKSVYIRGLYHEATTKEASIALLQFIEDEYPDFFDTVENFTKNCRSDMDPVISDYENGGDPVVLGYIDIRPSAYPALLKKIGGGHSIQRFRMERAICGKNKKVDESLLANLSFETVVQLFPDDKTDNRHGFKLLSLGRLLQLRAIGKASNPPSFFEPGSPQGAGMRCLFGLNEQGLLDFNTWQNAQPVDFLSGSAFFTKDLPDKLNSRPSSYPECLLANAVANTTHVMILSGAPPKQVFTIASRLCQQISDHFLSESPDDDLAVDRRSPSAKELLEKTFPVLIFHPFESLWTELGISAKDFRGLELVHLDMKLPGAFRAFGGQGILGVLETSKERHKLQEKRQSSIASQYINASLNSGQADRIRESVLEFLNNPQRLQGTVHPLLTYSWIIKNIPEQLVINEVQSALSNLSNDNDFCYNNFDIDEDYWGALKVIRADDYITDLIHAAPQEMYDRMVLETIHSNDESSLNMLIDLRQPSRSVFENLPDVGLSRILEDDLGL